MFDFLNSKKREARRLNRDSVAIIRADCRDHDAKHLERIAQQTKEYLQQARERSKHDPNADYRNLAYLETEHKKNRLYPSQVTLGAVTLAIIYLRAEKLGDDTKPAINAIEEFVEERNAGSKQPLELRD